MMSTSKVMASIFLDGVLLMDYLDKSYTITGAYYVDLLRQLRENIGVESEQQECSSTRTMHWLTRSEAMAAIQKCVSNLSNSHSILLIWVPMTTICSRK